MARCDNVCIICREEMLLSTRNKKLTCGHVFHMHCLRSSSSSSHHTTSILVGPPQSGKFIRSVACASFPLVPHPFCRVNFASHGLLNCPQFVKNERKAAVKDISWMATAALSVPTASRRRLKSYPGRCSRSTQEGLHLVCRTQIRTSLAHA